MTRRGKTSLLVLLFFFVAIVVAVFFFTSFSFYMYLFVLVCVCVYVSMNVLWFMCESQMTNCGSQFSFATIWDLGTQCKSVGLVARNSPYSPASLSLGPLL